MTARPLTCVDVSGILERPSRELTASTSKGALVHISDCDNCSARLKDAREHAVAMLKILERVEAETEADLNPDVEKQRDKVIRAVQSEYLVVAKAADRFLGDEAKKLATPLPAGVLEDAFSHLDVSEFGKPAVARLALAQLEAGVALSAFLGAGEGTLRATGDVQVGDKTIPANEFANLLEDTTGAASAAVWQVLVRCAMEGGVGMPGLQFQRLSSESARVTVAIDPVPDYKVRITE